MLLTSLLTACSDGGGADATALGETTAAGETTTVSTTATSDGTVSGTITSSATSAGGTAASATSGDAALSTSSGVGGTSAAGVTTSTDASTVSSVSSSSSTGGAGGGGGSSVGSFGGSSTTGGAGGDAGLTSTTGVPPTEPVTVFLAGDSIVQTYPDTASTTDQAGWGQMLADYFDTLATVENHAIGGRTARRFIEEGRLQEIADELEAGDYLLVQFGTNDGNTTATYTLNGQTIPYYLDPDTDFKTYLSEYIEIAREHDVTPVFVTPTPRNSAYCTGGNGTGAHAEAMRELGAAEDVAVSDLNGKTVAHLMAICPAPSPEDFFFVRSDGSVDGTHFQENGARILAGFVAEGVAEANLPLASYLK